MIKFANKKFINNSIFLFPEHFSMSSKFHWGNDLLPFQNFVYPKKSVKIGPGGSGKLFTGIFTPRAGCKWSNCCNPHGLRFQNWRDDRKPISGDTIVVNHTEPSPKTIVAAAGQAASSSNLTQQVKKKYLQQFDCDIISHD